MDRKKKRALLGASQQPQAAAAHLKRWAKKESPMSVSVSRSVTAFDKKTEKLVFEQHFAVHDFASLYARCGTPKEDPELFDVYPIKKEDFAFYATLLPASFSFDFDRFDYFLDASAV